MGRAPVHARGRYPPPVFAKGFAGTGGGGDPSGALGGEWQRGFCCRRRFARKKLSPPRQKPQEQKEGGPVESRSFFCKRESVFQRGGGGEDEGSLRRRLLPPPLHLRRRSFAPPVRRMCQLDKGAHVALSGASCKLWGGRSAGAKAKSLLLEDLSPFLALRPHPKAAGQLHVRSKGGPGEFPGAAVCGAGKTPASSSQRRRGRRSTGREDPAAEMPADLGGWRGRKPGWGV